MLGHRATNSLVLRMKYPGQGDRAHAVRVRLGDNLQVGDRLVVVVWSDRHAEDVVGVDEAFPHVVEDFLKGLDDAARDTAARCDLAGGLVGEEPVSSRS